MPRPPLPRTLDAAIARLEQKAVEAASKATPTKKASKQLLDVLHHLTCLQLVKAMTDGESIAGQTFSAAQRYLQANAIKREPGFEDGGVDGADNYAAHLDKLSEGLDLPYDDDDGDIEDYNILKDNSK